MVQFSSIQEQKKELKALSSAELAEICLRLSKYKKDNKELLNYLLFHQHDPRAYVDSVKAELQVEFEQLNKQSYYCSKSLRKILRNLSRQAKYVANTELELDMLLWFCTNYLQYVDLKTNNKSLQNILLRQFQKMEKLSKKLHEDLQFDYQQESDKIYKLAQETTNWFNL
jgi:hypothetical protein